MAETLQSARRHYARSALLGRRAVTEARKAAAAAGSAASSGVVSTIALYQAASASQAPAAMAQMLAEQSIDAAAEGILNSLAFVTAADSMLTMLDQVQVDSQQDVDWQFDRLVASLVADAGRAAESVSIAATPGAGWVRYLNPPSCSRCAVLAGRIYRWSSGFDRHPGCDCVHVATNAAAAPGLITDPTDLLRNGQITGLAKADAQALSDGASWSQVINAKSGMTDVTLYGRRAQVTTAGTTRRGAFGSSDFAATAGYDRRSVGRRGAVANSNERTTRRARLTPKAIYDAADGDRDTAIRLLKSYGYIS